MEDKRILFDICGSLCSHAAVLEQLTALCEHNNVTAVVNENVYACSTHFFDKDVLMGKVRDVTRHGIIHTIVETEKVGLADVYGIMVIAPMAAIVTAKMAHGIYGHLATLSAKAMICN